MQDTSSNSKPDAGKLPAFLFEPFQRYKRDTDRLASWLASTAQSLGYTQETDPANTLAGVAPPGTSTKKTGRLKGKARKLAKQAAAPAATPVPATVPINDSSENHATSTTGTTLNTGQFVTLARFIAAANNPPAAVPPRVIDWAARAIRARRQCAEWFQLHALAKLADAAEGHAGDAQVETDKSNDSHQYFIGILESVIAILSPRIKSEYGKGKVNLAAIAVDLDEGRFAALAREEEAAEDAETADYDGQDCDQVDKPVVVEETKQSAPTDIDYAATLARNAARAKHKALVEFMQAYMDFLSDVFQSRLAVVYAWKDYYLTGEPSLEIAGLIATAAVDAVQADYDALWAKYPIFMPDEQRLFEMSFNLRVALAKRPLGSTEPINVWGVSLDIHPSPSDGALSADALVQKFTEGSCVHAGLVLDWFRGGLQAGGTNGAGQGVHPSVRDSPSVKRMPMEAVDAMERSSEQLEKDYAVLKGLDQMWDNVKKVYTPFRPFVPVVDTLDSLRSDPTSPVPFPKRFATQLYLDMTLLSTRAYADDTEAGYLTRILDDASLQSHQMLQDTADCVAHVPDMSNDMLSRTQLLAMLEKLRCMIPCAHANKAHKTFEFNPVHPWAAGVLNGRARVMVLNFVCELEEKEPFIYMAAYLYAAVNQGLRDLRVVGKDESLSWWPMMDKYIEFVGAERLFYGKDPSSISDVWKSFMLQLGMSGVDMKLRLTPPAGRESTFRQGIVGKVDRPGFLMAPLADGAMSPAFKAFMKRFSSVTVSGKHVGEHYQRLGDCHVADGAGPGKNQLKSLGRSEYLKVIQSELIQHQPMLSLDMLLLRAQACRVVNCLKTAFSPHAALLLPGFPTILAGFGDYKLQVSLLITALASPDGQSPAGHMARVLTVVGHKVPERRRVLQGILTKIRAFGQEMVAADEAKRDI